jgi:hypothetical protein
MRLLTAAATCTLALAAAGCGGGDDEPRRAAGAAARLEVVVRPAGEGTLARRTRIDCEALGAGAASGTCRRLAGLTPADLAPVPGGTACAQVYGGPAIATVTGTLRGEAVAARFDLTDSCQIERWRRNRALLGPVP